MNDLLIIDKYTGEQSRYVQTETWYDNTTPMDDSLCDHIIYIQHEHTYYKRVLNDYITVKMFGAVGDGLTDDSEAIQKAVDFCERTSQKTLFFPPGNYLLNTPIENSRGGVKFIGAGSLLREESWWKVWNSNQQPHSPFSGCSLIIPKNSSGFVFKNTVTDPIFIESIQFLSKEGRVETIETPGTTYAIDFKSEFNGPTWPFIVRDCHFRGFNRAISFKSATAYNVASVQITGCAFSLNDECLYFGFADDDEQRNMSWGFLFENNKCHNNSRVIYGYFAKDLVRIIDNNFEGSIPYSYNSLNTDFYSIDIEIDNAAVQFFGNHFEGMASNAVYISSLRKDINGDYIYKPATTALSNRNKVEIFGNNMDGMYPPTPPNPEQIKFNLTGVQIINKDDILLSVHACEIVENNAVKPNIFLNEEAKKNGTVIKFSDTDGSSYLLNNTLDNYDFKKLPVSPKSMLIDGEQYESKGNGNSSYNHFYGGFTFAFNSVPEYLGATFKIKNRLDVFTANVFFNIFHIEGSNVVSPYVKETMATLFTKGGDSLIVAIVPNKDYFPPTSNRNAFTAGLNFENMSQLNTLVATDVTYFTFSEEDPIIFPYYMKSNLVDKVGTFSQGQTFIDMNNQLNVVTKSGTLGTPNFLSGVTISGTAGNNFITTNMPQKLTTGQYIEIPNTQISYRITGCKNGDTFYLNELLPASLSDVQCVFSPPVISII
ncbi:hypothetical protein ASG22_10810 [Chryseobacterium sp. Leaf405]|uniref:glycosyl hydrolase family 28-related protein n=1 Tax=Chryseobacterium sp. Leaf405 TaxID=1736367 RepID=UPI0006F8AFA5|nr:glycosyl hydrolase family 28-related protein [Chryseobacterium sp. Leaf405]KQT24484.1 hypothetical protein ASG22_10810 [Chryseobacterium sp. Leaf405]